MVSLPLCCSRASTRRQRLAGAPIVEKSSNVTQALGHVTDGQNVTDSQILGELGETAIKKLVLEMHFIYESRGRPEAGNDGIIELPDPKSGAPFGKLLGVQVKATESGRYICETGP